MDVYTYCSFVDDKCQCRGVIIVRGKPSLKEFEALAKRCGMSNGEIMPIHFSEADVGGEDGMPRAEFELYLANLDKFFSPEEIRALLAAIEVECKYVWEWENQELN
jgi:hypothetical protein